ncbi:MAG: hypothetical protein IJ427_05965 [Lachnospiraceae bacterium]|nr:hypothetical protein [Lachnospiraceae bacterium]
MKEELMFEGITNIREDIIERAEGYVFPGENESGVNRKSGWRKLLKANPVWVTVTVAAACLLLVIGTPFVYMATRKCGSEAAPKPGDPGQSSHGSVKPGDVETGREKEGDMAPEIGIATDNVWIYYVEAGEICREQHFVTLQAADVFAVWKEKNGIGDEVQLLDCEIRSNATTEQMGEVVKHTVGDYHALYLTVSKNLETYYEQRAEVPLLESLEQTMTGYSGRAYQEYHLILE